MAKYGIYINQGNISVSNDGKLTATQATVSGAVVANEVKTSRKRPITIEFRNAKIANQYYNFRSTGEWDLNSNLVLQMSSSCASGCASSCSGGCIGGCQGSCMGGCGGCSGSCGGCGGCDKT